VSRNHDADGLDLVDAGVGRIKDSAIAIEPDFSLDPRAKLFGDAHGFGF
jgi:hypothetical protein